MCLYKHYCLAVWQTHAFRLWQSFLGGKKAVYAFYQVPSVNVMLCVISFKVS